MTTNIYEGDYLPGTDFSYERTKAVYGKTHKLTKGVNIMKHIIYGWAIAMAGMLMCKQAYAFEPLIEVGVQSSFYSDDTSTEPSYKVNLGAKGFPVYGFVGYENPKQKVLGQPISDLGLTSFGVGAGKGFGPDFWIALELGYVSTDVNQEDHVVKEVVYTQLVNNHAVPGRPIPITPRGYEASYEVDDGLLGRVVVGYQLFEHVAVTGSYRWLQLDQEIRGLQDGLEWREDTTADLNAFELGLWYTW